MARLWLVLAGTLAGLCMMGIMEARTRQPKARHRTRHGEGSFYWRDSDQRWVGVLDAGWTERGTRKRVSVSDAHEDKAWQKFVAKRKAILLEGDAGVRPKTVKTWADEWLARRIGDVKPKTFISERAVVQKWMIPSLGRKRLAQLTPGDIRAMLDQAKDSGSTATNRRYIQRIVQQCLRDARMEGQDVPEAVLKMRKPSASVSDRGPIPLEHVAAILRQGSGLPHLSRWQVAFLTGMRQGEMLGLTWEAVDFDAKLIRVDWQLQELTRHDGEYVIPEHYEVRQLRGSYHLLRPKSKAGRRIIPMSPDVERLLKAWRESGTCQDGLVWPRTNGRPRSNKHDRQEWYRLQDEAGVTHETGRRYLIHEIRHSTVSLLLAGGVNPYVIEAIVGHSKLVENYVSVDEVQVRAALAVVEGLPALEG